MYSALGASISLQLVSKLVCFIYTSDVYMKIRYSHGCMMEIQRQVQIVQVLSSIRDGRQFGHNRHGKKIGGCVHGEGELGPHLTQSGRGLFPYQVAS